MNRILGTLFDIQDWLLCKSSVRQETTNDLADSQLKRSKFTPQDYLRYPPKLSSQRCIVRGDCETIPQSPSSRRNEIHYTSNAKCEVREPLTEIPRVALKDDKNRHDQIKNIQQCFYDSNDENQLYNRMTQKFKANDIPNDKERSRNFGVETVVPTQSCTTCTTQNSIQTAVIDECCDVPSAFVITSRQLSIENIGQCSLNSNDEDHQNQSQMQNFVDADPRQKNQAFVVNDRPIQDVKKLKIQSNTQDYEFQIDRQNQSFRQMLEIVESTKDNNQASIERQESQQSVTDSCDVQTRYQKTQSSSLDIDVELDTHCTSLNDDQPNVLSERDEIFDDIDSYFTTNLEDYCSQAEEENVNVNYKIDEQLLTKFLHVLQKADVVTAIGKLVYRNKLPLVRIELTVGYMLCILHRGKFQAQELSIELMLSLLWLAEKYHSQYRNNVENVLKDYMDFCSLPPTQLSFRRTKVLCEMLQSTQMMILRRIQYNCSVENISDLQVFVEAISEFCIENQNYEICVPFEDFCKKVLDDVDLRNHRKILNKQKY